MDSIVSNEYLDLDLEVYQPDDLVPGQDSCNLAFDVHIDGKRVDKVKYDLEFHAPSYGDIPPEIKFSEDFSNGQTRYRGKEVKAFIGTSLVQGTKEFLKAGFLAGGAFLGLAAGPYGPLAAVGLGAAGATVGRYLGDRLGDYVESKQTYKFFQEQDWGKRSFGTSRATMDRLEEDYLNLPDEIAPSAEYNERILHAKLKLNPDAGPVVDNTFVSVRYDVRHDKDHYMPFSLTVKYKPKGEKRQEKVVRGYAVFHDDVFSRVELLKEGEPGAEDC
ncbi:MAG: hypothetical protein QGG26_16270 [Candidatus Undinarchaeales archaeon]|jgi:hypothetical protein|nr:hypothetical protein [Candidatus Undinarchaeales archaeon]